LSHSLAICRPISSVAALKRRAHRDGSVGIRSKQSKMCRSPSIWRLVISQLLVPELRGAPV
jgi:hypothetical protein